MSFLEEFYRMRNDEEEEFPYGVGVEPVLLDDLYEERGYREHIIVVKPYVYKPRPEIRVERQTRVPQNSLSALFWIPLNESDMQPFEECGNAISAFTE